MVATQNSHMIAAAIGAAIGILSAATVFIYNKIKEKNQHSTMNSNIDKVNRKILALETEIEELRTQQENLQKTRRRRRKHVYSNDNSYSTETNDIDTYSTAGTDIGDEEFFDCSDDEVDDIENGMIGQAEEDPEVMELFEEHDDDSFYISSYDKLKVALKKYPYNVEIIWRFARSCYHCSLKDDEKRKDYIFEGCDTCEKILTVTNGKLYEWYAILIGVKSKFLPLKERILSGFQFRKYVEKALEINPHNGFLYYLLGRFKFEICELNWIEKKLAATFLAGLPNGNYNDAILDFLKSEELSKKPNYINKLYLGKSYVALGNYEEAITWLSQIKDINATNTEETKVLSEAKELLEKYSNDNT